MEAKGSRGSYEAAEAEAMQERRLGVVGYKVLLANAVSRLIKFCKQLLRKHG